MFLHEYDSLDENIVYQFPDSIINEIKTKFSGYALPTICNGIEVIIEENTSSTSRTRTAKKKFHIPQVS